MTDSNKKILLTLLGIIFIAAAYFLVVSPKMDSCKSLQNEIDDLQARYDDLCQKELQKDQIIKETEEYNAQFDDVVAKFAPDLDQENTVMFLKATEVDNEFVNLAVSMPRETAYYILGEGAVADNTAQIDTEEDAYVVVNDNYNISFSGTYKGVKEYLDYVANYKYRMAIEQITITYDEAAESPLAECSGALTLNTYAVKHVDRIADVPKLTVDEGKDNIFATEGEGLPVGAGSTDYDSDNGAAIAGNHNLVIMLNNADNDTTSGIIVASSETNEATYVTSSSNDVEDLKLEVTTEDGKNYVTYSIGSKSYKAEILSSELTVYVKSSARAGDDDKNGVNVKLSNDTTIPVYFKVADDDSSNPRFKLAEKAGTVKVY